MALTPCDANFIKKINQSEFAGFSYFNEEEFLRRYAGELDVVRTSNAVYCSSFSV